MKPKILKLSTLILLFALIGAGCQDDDELFELQIGDENALIEKTVDGIEFKFCLLNEQGEAATVFNDGENFTFRFTFTNHTLDTIIVSPDFVNDDFFRVFSEKGSSKLDLGKPYDNVWYSPYAIITPDPYEIKPEKFSGLQCPWVFSIGQVTTPFCVKEYKDYLQIGSYFTNLALDFSYKIGTSEKRIKNIDFKINFEIK